MEPPLATQPNFQLVSRYLGALPLMNHFLERLGLEKLLNSRLLPPDGRCRISTTKVLLVLLRNLVVSRSPLYSLSQWAAQWAPEVLGLCAEQVGGLNDDRLGRALDELFASDRQTLLSEFVLQMVREFRVDLGQLHNDSTSLSFQGQYRQADGRRVEGLETPAITFGYSKDHRPDLKQLLWILTMSWDGAVPICFKVSDGNVEDSTTHRENWDLLRQLVGTADFLYVADSKLCTTEALTHIDRQAGRFLTPLPQFRKEDGRFRRWLATHPADWQEIGRRPQPGKGDEIIESLESPVAEVHGFRLVWFRSSEKRQRDAQKRQQALERAQARLDQLQARLQGPRCRFKHRKTVAKAVDQILQNTGSSRWIEYQIEWKNEVIFRQEKRDTKNPMPRLRRSVRSRFRLDWQPRLCEIRADAQADGISPLVTNAYDLSPWKIYRAYHRHQPQLEQRHDLLKNTLQITPAYLHSIRRIDAFLFLAYLALTVYALVERELRRQMSQRGIEHLPLYPEGRPCRAPTARCLFRLFRHLQIHTLFTNGKPLQSFPPRLTPLQLQLLTLLDIPNSCYLHADQ
jgi:transposase